MVRSEGGGSRRTARERDGGAGMHCRGRPRGGRAYGPSGRGPVCGCRDPGGRSELLVGEVARVSQRVQPDEVALATMEIIKLDRKIIEDRFNLEQDQGCTIELFGDATKGILGTGFLYTNKDTLSIGVGTLLSGLIKHKIKPYELLEYVKHHPMIRPYLQGGEPQEYLAHLIPEGGYYSMPKVVGDGVLVVGDAAQLVNAIHREGSNMAMTSGRLAAETVVKAKEEGDYSERVLDHYRKRLMDSFVGQDLKKYKDATHHFDRFPQYFDQYIPMMNRAASQMFTVDGSSKKEKQRKIWNEIGPVKEKLKIARDLYRAWKVMK